MVNTTGSFHTAVGWDALQNCIAAPDFAGNTAIGSEAPSPIPPVTSTRQSVTAHSNSTPPAAANTAIGLDALISNTIGTKTPPPAVTRSLPTPRVYKTRPLAFSPSLATLPAGNNTAVGNSALNANATGNSNTAIGTDALVPSTGNGNTALGANAGNAVATANNVIAIGTAGADVSNSCFIGNISGVEVTGDPVVVAANGQLGVAPAGSPLSANELLKQQRVVQELKATTERQAAVIALQEGQIKALTAGLQKVSAQLEARKPAPRVVSNP